LSNENNLEFFVRDTGQGIALIDPNVVFEPFRQEELGYTRKYGGIGLGLAISKKLVELLGGEIQLQTVTGEDSGTTIYFTLPYEPIVKKKSTKENKTSFPKLKTGNKVLVVDDDEINLFVITKMLEKAGYIVEEALDGDQAVSKYKENPDIDLVIMDLRMPVKDGYVATKEIRRVESIEGFKKVPIISLSAATLEHEEERSLEAGCNYFITKPVKWPALLNIMAKCLHKEK